MSDKNSQVQLMLIHSHIVSVCFTASLYVCSLCVSQIQMYLGLPQTVIKHQKNNC